MTTTKSSAKLRGHSLLSVGAKVIGTVFNGFDVTKAYGYRYKYA